MKKYTLLLMLIATSFLAACSSGQATPTIEPTTTRPSLPSASDLPSPTPPLAEAGYPAPPGQDQAYPAPGPQSSYPAPEQPPGYPMPDSPTPPPAAYPDLSAFVQHPAGAQCEEIRYPDLASAVTDLETAGIQVINAEQIEMDVCAACGCPTSTQFRAEISADDLNMALALGWERG